MKTNFALIGAGKFGKNYIRLLEKTNRVSLKVIATRETNLREVLKNPALQCVIIATPPKTHYKIAKTAIRYKKNILIEKPMVLNLKEAKDLKKSLKNYEKTFMVGFQYIYNDHIQYIKKEIGKSSFGIIREMKWEHYLSPPRKDVNCFLDVVPHALSVFQFLFNPNRIKYVKKKKNSKNSVHITICFDRGPLLTILASWQGIKKVRKVTFMGEKNNIILDKDKLKIDLKSEKKIKNEPLKNELNQFIHSIKTRGIPLTDIEFGYRNTMWLEEISHLI